MVALALLPLLTPLFMHPALDAAGSATWLGLSDAQTHDLSDNAVAELVFGPGSFAFPGPDGRHLFDLDERRHLGDARTLLIGFLVLAAIAAAAIAVAIGRAHPVDRASLWRAVATGGGVAAIVTPALGLLAVVAFDPLFRLFHLVVFPGGNWAFDPASQRLVQLYPARFWELAVAALGGLVMLLGLVAWRMGGRMAGRSA